MVVTFSMCTSCSSRHHHPWPVEVVEHYLGNSSEPATTLSSSSEYVISSSIFSGNSWLNSFGVSRGILEPFIESVFTFSFMLVPLPRHSRTEPVCRGQLCSAPKSLNIPSGLSCHSMKWKGGSAGASVPLTCPLHPKFLFFCLPFAV